jgi:hypothetical protein
VLALVLAAVGSVARQKTSKMSVVTFRPARTSQRAGRVSEMCGGWVRNGFVSRHLRQAQRFDN